MEFSDHRQHADAEPTLPTMDDLDRLAADLDRVDATLEALDRGVIGRDSVGGEIDRQAVPEMNASA